MSIRDLALFAIVFAGVPFMLRRPFIGLLFWVWIGIMNPQQLMWGDALTFPFAMVVAIATLLGLFIGRSQLRFKGSGEFAILVVLFLWMSLTTVVAFNPALAFAAMGSRGQDPAHGACCVFRREHEKATRRATLGACAIDRLLRDQGGSIHVVDWRRASSIWPREQHGRRQQRDRPCNHNDRSVVRIPAKPGDQQMGQAWAAGSDVVVCSRGLGQPISRGLPRGVGDDVFPLVEEPSESHAWFCPDLLGAAVTRFHAGHVDKSHADDRDLRGGHFRDATAELLDHGDQHSE